MMMETFLYDHVKTEHVESDDEVKATIGVAGPIADDVTSSRSSSTARQSVTPGKDAGKNVGKDGKRVRQRNKIVTIWTCILCDTPQKNISNHLLQTHRISGEERAILSRRCARKKVDETGNVLREIGAKTEEEVKHLIAEVSAKAKSTGSKVSAKGKIGDKSKLHVGPNTSDKDRNIEIVHEANGQKEAVALEKSAVDGQKDAVVLEDSAVDGQKEAVALENPIFSSQKETLVLTKSAVSGQKEAVLLAKSAASISPGKLKSLVEQKVNEKPKLLPGSKPKARIIVMQKTLGPNNTVFLRPTFSPVASSSLGQHVIKSSATQAAIGDASKACDNSNDAMETTHSSEETKATPTNDGTKVVHTSDETNATRADDGADDGTKAATRSHDSAMAVSLIGSHVKSAGQTSEHDVAESSVHSTQDMKDYSDVWDMGIRDMGLGNVERGEGEVIHQMNEMDVIEETVETEDVIEETVETEHACMEVDHPTESLEQTILLSDIGVASEVSGNAADGDTEVLDVWEISEEHAVETNQQEPKSNSEDQTTSVDDNTGASTQVTNDPEVDMEASQIGIDSTENISFPSPKYFEL